MPQLQSAARVVATIEYIASTGGARLDEVADALGVHKSSALRLLATLRELGWIVSDDRRHYVVGPHLVAVGQAAAAGSSLQHILSLAEELRDLTGETVHVATPYGDRMLTVGRIDSSNAHRVSYDLGSQDQLHVSAVGKAYLASLSESAFEALLPQLDLKAETPFSITSETALRDEIGKTRERGYSLNLEETTLGVCSLGFAVRLGSNLEMVALSITGPAHRWTREAIDEIAPDLLKLVVARSPLIPVAPA